MNIEGVCVAGWPLRNAFAHLLGCIDFARPIRGLPLCFRAHLLFKGRMRSLMTVLLGGAVGCLHVVLAARHEEQSPTQHFLELCAHRSQSSTVIHSVATAYSWTLSICCKAHADEVFPALAVPACSGILFGDWPGCAGRYILTTGAQAFQGLQCSCLQAASLIANVACGRAMVLSGLSARFRCVMLCVCLPQ